MKILFITDLYPIRKGESRTPLTLHNFVFDWIQQGHEVDVIKPNFIFNSFLRNKPFYVDGFYEYEGVKVLNVNFHSPFLFDITKKIPNTLDISSYDLIIGHMPSGVIFANKLARIFQKPLVCGVHCSDIEVLSNPIYGIYFKNQLKDAYQNAQKIACRSFVLQNKFNKLMPELAEKTFVASSGVDVQVAKSKGQKAKGTCEEKTELEAIPKEKPLTVLTCANLIKRKNIDKLILSINSLEGFELTVIGSGKELKRLKRMSDSNIKFLGQLPNEKVLEEMQKADVFVLPSVNETFGMVYLEAMASGCITVGTINDGVDGIIKDGENGFLCEPTYDGIKDTLLKIKALCKNFEDMDKILESSLKTVAEYTSDNCAKNYLINSFN